MSKNKCIIITLLLTSFFGCEPVDPLIKLYGNPCYTDRNSIIHELFDDNPLYAQKNIGACSTGLTDQNDLGEYVCSGEVKPTLETCNNIDDDCDGRIDKSWSGWTMELSRYHADNFCFGVGVCKDAVQQCHDGVWKCIYPNSHGREVCDGLDNDCDGQVDEDSNDEPIIPLNERYVYPADISTVNVGECRAGYKQCVDGKIEIRGLRTPVEEICGNNTDDDCDGLVDEDENGAQSTDFLFVIDYSGSMEFVVNSITTAVCNWSSQGVLNSSRFAIIAVGKYGNPRQMQIITDFTNSSNTCSILRNTNYQTHYGWLELQLSAIYEASEPASEHYIRWLAGNTRKVLVFSDEILQQDISFDVPSAIDMVTEQCILRDYAIGAFISPENGGENEWIELTQRCNGFVDYLSNDSAEMINILNYWVGTQC